MMRGIIGLLLGAFMAGYAMADAPNPANQALRDAQTLWEVINAVEAGATNLNVVYRDRIANGWDKADNPRVLEYLVGAGATIKLTDLNEIYAGMLMSMCGGGTVPPEKQAFFANPELKYDPVRGIRNMLDTVAFSEKSNVDKVMCLLNVASQNGAGESEITYAYDKAVRYNNQMLAEITRNILGEIAQMKSKQ
ncbi:hypothetical protein HDR63_04395 [bacterium]|nr:hypothetical protein [bacterium]